MLTNSILLSMFAKFLHVTAIYTVYSCEGASACLCVAECVPEFVVCVRKVDTYKFYRGEQG